MQRPSTIRTHERKTKMTVTGVTAVIDETAIATRMAAETVTATESAARGAETGLREKMMLMEMRL